MSLPKKTRNNGTLYALIFVHQAGVTPWQDPRQVHLVAHLTTYIVPKPPEISLISREEQTQVRRCSKLKHDGGFWVNTEVVKRIATTVYFFMYIQVLVVSL